MSVNVANYIFAMEERQRALRGNNLHAEDGVGVPANSNVKRCLFGERPDPIELQRKYDEVHREDMRQKEKKWGFNFETETPTDNSRFQWERVHSDVPVSYAMPQLGTSQAPPPVHPEDSAENSASSSDAERSPSPGEATASSSGSSKQSLITDYLPQKRHAKSVKSAVKRQRASPSPVAGGSGGEQLHHQQQPQTASSSSNSSP